MKNYRVNLVIANELHTRYDEIRLVKAKANPIRSIESTGSDSLEKVDVDVDIDVDVEVIRRRSSESISSTDPSTLAVTDPFTTEIEHHLVERLHQIYSQWQVDQPM